MQASQLRNLYLDYFARHGHKLLPGSSLLPKDPTLLFNSAGMVQFKEFFSGRLVSPFPRVTTCQKCFRTTDIENVGKTAWHHTFFEMLGNFSFGDYFKEEAIKLAWQFLTKELAIAPNRLWASVYEGDMEAYSIWHDLIGIPGDRIARLGKEHNWWGPVGDTGACGPDSEVFYDVGEDKACGTNCRGVVCDCGRFSEIWNLVFMEYETQENGDLISLKQKSIDTGMGLERMAAVLQGVQSDFEIDLFQPIIQAIEASVPRTLSPTDLINRNIIADHIRGVVFLLADGVVPGNDKQGYVLRRVLRRAVRAGERLGLPSGVLPALVGPVVDSLEAVYPEIGSISSLAERVIVHEEKTFRKTLRDGERRLGEILDALVGEGNISLCGDIAFELYDTYGFPLEMTKEIAAERGIVIDVEGFRQGMEKQRARSRRAPLLNSPEENGTSVSEIHPTEFVGYQVMQTEGQILDLDAKDSAIKQLVFDRTPFYAEAGGQIADGGKVENLSRTGLGRIVGVKKTSRGVFLHQVQVVEGAFAVEDKCKLGVDAVRRRRIARNHTATHLIHAALRAVLGKHVMQAGSRVSDKELRFDFSHFEGVNAEEIAEIEDLVNETVLADVLVKTQEMPLLRAKKMGALAHFDEEYKGKDLVRVVSVGDSSQELCGGTHVSRSGEIGLIKITSEESISSGVRRIHAVTGDNALSWLRETDKVLLQLRSELGGDPPEGLRKLRTEMEGLRARAEQVVQQSLTSISDELVSGAEKVAGIRLISGRHDAQIAETKQLSDLIEQKSRPAVVLLAGNHNDRGLVVCKASDGIGGINADVLVRTMASILGGGGGGNSTFAQGGGPQTEKVDEALRAGLDAARSLLEGSG